MAFELSLRLPFSIPRLFRAHSDEPRHAFHWIGQTRETSEDGTEPGGQRPKPERDAENQGYRPLSSIRLGEVEDAIKVFENQLIPAHDNWVGKNLFCTIPLKRIRDGRPPAIFGRVNACYPSDGHLENIEDIELLFPRKDRAPDRVILHKEDISRYSQRAAESYYIRVQFKASTEDKADFDDAGVLFTANGFFPEFDAGYYDLLEMNDQNQSAYPWLYVIGSRWFDAVPDSLHAEVRAKIREMDRWGKRIFNYHPDWLPKEINTLNRVLGFKYEFTPTLFTEPSTPHETAHITAKMFARFFMPASAR